VLATGNQTEFGLTVAAIPVVLVLLVFAGVAVRREIKWLMSLSLVLMLASESYFSACLPRVCGAAS
jgi:cytochrome bd-type quinol oxidase subunit 2